jgi:VanZ family protein
MAYARKAVYSRRYRQPSLLNNLLFQASLFKPFKSSEFPMTNSRRNIIIRTVSAVAGDIAVGLAVASACIWIIEAAALGVFLSFLVWLLGALAALAVSQYVLHPALTAALSDRKLDLAVEAVTGLADRLTLFARAALQPV